MELTITKENFAKAYASADEKQKQLLENLFGKPEPVNIMDRVKTFEDALAIVGASDNLKTLLDYNGVDKDMLAAVAQAKLSIIAKALNEGWKPNWEDDDYKYYAWFEYKSGFGFACSVWTVTYTSANVGSRLVFKTSELAEFAGKQFEKLYNDLFTL